jgi:hypothetical protein
MRKTMAVAAFMLIGISHQAAAITVIGSNPAHFVNHPGSFSPVSEVSAVIRLIRGTDDDLIVLDDSDFLGVPDGETVWKDRVPQSVLQAQDFLMGLPRRCPVCVPKPASIFDT